MDEETREMVRMVFARHGVQRPRRACPLDTTEEVFIVDDDDCGDLDPTPGRPIIRDVPSVPNDFREVAIELSGLLRKKVWVLPTSMSTIDNVEDV